MQTHNNKETRVIFWATGLMLFALFFGAGNLIFPAKMGLDSGTSYITSVLGFIITGAGLPLLGVAAIAYSRERDVQALAGRVSPFFGLAFAVLLYLSIGPLFAIPRTATVSFEMGVAPLLGESIADPEKFERIKPLALNVFSFLFFAVSLWMALSPGKLMDRIGKILTPALLACIALLVGIALIKPLGAYTAPSGNYVSNPFVQGFLDGYQTMDALAALVFAIIVIETLHVAGVRNVENQVRMTIGAGMIAAGCLAVVYFGVCYIGASSAAVTSGVDNGAALLAMVADAYWGLFGSLVLVVIVMLACISTAVGLITSCGSYFNRICPKISYTNWAGVFTVVSYLFANKGLAGIISFSIPMLMLLYPLTMVLLLLTFTHKLYGGMRSVYVSAMMLTLVIGVLDAYKQAIGFPEAVSDTLNTWIPLYGEGVGWILPALAGMALGWVWGKKSHSPDCGRKQI